MPNGPQKSSYSNDFKYSSADFTKKGTKFLFDFQEFTIQKYLLHLIERQMPKVLTAK